MSGPEASLLDAAIAGDELALQRLLIPLQSRLATRIAGKLPPRLQGIVSAEDILQETYVEVFSAIRTFVPDGESAFEKWLFRIADNHVTDVIRRLDALKRGGGRKRIEPSDQRGSMISLLERLQVDAGTPSQASAQDEALAAMQVALASLKPDYRDALCLRYLDGLSAAEVAERLGRSEWSVHKLCRRGLDALRESMGRVSRYFSVK